jgi:hypothetical protein
VIAGEAQLKPCFPVMAKMALQTAGSTEGSGILRFGDSGARTAFENPFGRKCYLCLRYVVEPMCPGRTNEEPAST